VINVVTYEMRERMNQTSAAYPYSVSEWDEAGLVPAPAARVRPVRVADSPLAMEYRYGFI
jgi:flavin reductase (DIM6/NTAB) family NADH-FMN oxidoreductase RutF